jgi:hypothetical protein
VILRGRDFGANLLARTFGADEIDAAKRRLGQLN